MNVKCTQSTGAPGVTLLMVSCMSEDCWATEVLSWRKPRVALMGSTAVGEREEKQRWDFDSKHHSRMACTTVMSCE